MAIWAASVALSDRLRWRLIKMRQLQHNESRLMKRYQRGVTFVGIVLIGIVVAALGVLAVRVVPTVIEYRSILHAVQQVALEANTAPAVRSAFERAKAVGYFDAVSGKDLVISQDGERLLIEFAYQEEIHLFGPAYLVIRYQGRSH